MEIGGNNISSFSPEEQHLSIELSSERISYSLLNTNNLEYVYFKSVSATENNSIINIISSEEVLKQEYSSSSISYKDFPSTLIPNELYKEEEKSKYLDFVTDNVESVKTDIIHQIDSTIIYSVCTDIENVINQIQPKISEKNSTNVAICQLIQQYEKKKEKTAFIFVNKKNIELIVLEKGKLIFQNYFTVSSSTDILYYTLFCFDQLNLDTNKNDLFLFGHISKGDVNYSLLYDYVRNIKFGEISNALSFTEELEIISNHKYFTLYSQLLCV